MTHDEWLGLLEAVAPLALAESWDAVGLQLAPVDPEPVRAALLTIDFTEAVLAEALSLGVDAVVAYHPPLFRPPARLVGATALERVIAGAVRAGLSVYSPHTALDAVAGGVNDWLAEAFAPASVAPLAPATAARTPAEGVGRRVRLDRPLSLEQAVGQVKRHLGLAAVRVACPEPGPPLVHQVALCAGAGGSVLEGQPADLYLTGEMRHHDVLAALGRGVAVVLTEHTHCERGYLPRLAAQLEQRAGGVVVHVSRADREPLTVR